MARVKRTAADIERLEQNYQDLRAAVRFAGNFRDLDRLLGLSLGSASRYASGAVTVTDRVAALCREVLA